MTKVLGFPVDEYDRSQSHIMTDVQLNEAYLEDVNVHCYDNVNDFFNDLNDGMVDTENIWWKAVKIN